MHFKQKKVMKKMCHYFFELFSQLCQKTLIVYLIVCLIFPSISVFRAHASDDLDIDGFNKNEMDIYFRQADKQEDHRLWRSIVESGYQNLISQWEDEALLQIEKKVAKKTQQQGLSLDEQAVLAASYQNQVVNQKATWENQARKEIESAYGDWLLDQFDLKWQQPDQQKIMQTINEANRKYLFETDANGQYIYENGYRKIKKLENENYWSDFNDWDSLVKGIIAVDLEKYEDQLAITAQSAKSKAQELLEPNQYTEFEQFLNEEQANRLANFEQERRFLYQQARSSMIYQRLYDTRSLRRDSEAASPEAIAENLIQDTQAEIDKETEKLLSLLETNLAPGSESDLAAFENMKESIKDAFKNGINKWRSAEEDFISKRIIWEKNARQALKEGEDAWQKAFDRFREARSQWENQYNAIIEQGMNEWISKENELHQNFEQAKKDLNQYLQSLKEEWSAAGDGLVTTINKGLNMIQQANENIQFFKEALKTTTTDAAIKSTYEDALKKWIDYRDNFALMVYNANQEYKQLVTNNLKGENYFIPAELNGADFQSMLNTLTDDQEKQHLADLYSLSNGVYRLKNTISQADQLKAMSYLDTAGYSGYRSDNDLLKQYQQSGILTDYDVELIEVKGRLNYWQERMAIIDDVIEFAEDYSSEQETDVQTKQRYEQAKQIMEDKKAVYEQMLSELHSRVSTLDDKKEEIETAAQDLESIKKEMDIIQEQYNSVIAALKYKQNGLEASKAPFHDEYCQLLLAVKKKQEYKNHYYDLLLSESKSQVIWDHYRQLTELICGDGKSYGVEDYRAAIQIADQTGISYDLNGDNQLDVDHDGNYQFEGLKNHLNPILEQLFVIQENGVNLLDQYLNTPAESNEQQPIKLKLDRNLSYAAEDFLSHLKAVYQLSGKKNLYQQEKYENQLKTRIMELEKSLLKLRESMSNDLTTLVCRVKLQMGEDGYDDDLFSNLAADWKTQSQNIALFNKVKADYAASHEGEQLTDQQAWLESASILLQQQFNNTRLGRHLTILTDFKADLQNITDYESLTLLLKEKQSAFINAYQTYKQDPDTIGFEEVEKLKISYQLVEKYLELFQNIHFNELVIAGRLTLSSSNEQEIRDANHLLLGLLQASGLVTGETLSDEDKEKLKGTAYEYYLTIFNSNDQTIKQNALNDLIEQNFSLLALLNINGLDNEQLVQLKDEKDEIINSSFTSFMQSLDQQINQTQSDLQYVIDHNQDAIIALDPYYYYQVRNQAQQSNDNPNTEINEKQNKIAYMQFIGQGSQFTAQFLSGIDLSLNRESFQNRQSSTFKRMADEYDAVRKNSLLVYKNQYQSPIYQDLKARLAGSTNLADLKIWIENYFQLHKGELSQDIENMLNNLLNGYQNIELISQLATDKDKILAALKDYENELLEQPSAKKEALLEEWKAQYEQQSSQLNQYFTHFIEMNQTIATMIAYDEVKNIEDPTNIQAYSQADIEHILDQIYASIKAIDIDALNMQNYYAELLSQNQTLLQEKTRQELEKRRDQLLELTQDLKNRLASLRNQYLKNLGLNAGQAFLEELSLSEDEIDYLNIEESKINDFVDQYLISTRKIASDLIDENAKDLVKSEIYYLLTRHYLLNTNYSFNENNQAENEVLVQSISDEVNRINSAYPLTENDRKEIQRYLKTRLFRQFETSLTEMMESDLKPGLYQSMLTQTLTDWLKEQTISSQSKAQDLYQEFMLTYLDQPQYVQWTVMENREVMENNTSIDTVRIQGWQKFNQSIVVNGKIIATFNDINDVSELENKGFKIIYDQDSKSSILVIENAVITDKELVLSQLNQTITFADSVLEKDEQQQKIILKSVCESNATSLLSQFYYIIEKNINRQQLKAEITTAQNRITEIDTQLDGYTHIDDPADPAYDADKEDLITEKQNLLTQFIPDQENQLNELESDLHEFVNISTYEPLAIVLRHFSQTGQVSEFDGYAKALVVKKFAQQYKQFQTGLKSDAYLKSSNHYHYLKLLNPNQDEQQLVDQVQINLPHLTDFENSSLAADTLAYLSASYTEALTGINEELAQLNQQLLELKNNDAGQSEIKAKEDEIQEKEAQKKSVLQLINRLATLNSDLPALKQDYYNLTTSQSALYAAVYFTTGSIEQDYYIKRYLLKADKINAADLDFLNLGHEKKNEYLLYSQTLDLLQQHSGNSKLSFAEFLDWQDLGLSEEEKEKILDFKNRYFNSALPLTSQFSSLIMSRLDQNVMQLKENYVAFKEQYQLLSQQFQQMLEDKNEQKEVTEQKIALLQGNMTTFRSYLKHLIFVEKVEEPPVDPNQTAAENETEDGINMDNSWKKVFGIPSLLDEKLFLELSPDSQTELLGFYTKQENNGKVSYRLTEGVLEIEDNVKILNRIFHELGYLSELNQKNLAYQDIVKDFKHSNLNQLKKLVDEDHKEGKNWLVPVYYTNSDKSLADEHLAGTFLDLFNTFYQDIDALNFVMNQNMTGEVDQYLDYLKNNYNAETGVRNNDELLNGEIQFNSQLNQSELSVKNGIKQFYDPDQLEQLNQKIKQTIDDYQTMSGNIIYLEDSLRKTGQVIEYKSQSIDKLKKSLDHHKANLHQKETAYETKEAAFNQLKNEYNQLNDSYLSYWNQVNAAYTEYQLARKEFKTRQKIMDYADSPFIEIGSGDAASIDEQTTTIDPVTGEIIDIEKEKVPGIDLYTLKEKIKNHLDKTQFVYDQLLKQYKNYDERMKALEELVVDDEGTTYADIRDEYDEATRRYTRMVKTYNDLVEKQRFLIAKEAELSAKQDEVQAELGIHDVSYEKASQRIQNQRTGKIELSYADSIFNDRLNGLSETDRNFIKTCYTLKEETKTVKDDSGNVVSTYTIKTHHLKTGLSLAQKARILRLMGQGGNNSHSFTYSAVFDSYTDHVQYDFATDQLIWSEQVVDHTVPTNVSLNDFKLKILDQITSQTERNFVDSCYYKGFKFHVLKSTVTGEEKNRLISILKGINYVNEEFIAQFEQCERAKLIEFIRYLNAKETPQIKDTFDSWGMEWFRNQNGQTDLAQVINSVFGMDTTIDWQKDPRFLTAAGRNVFTDLKDKVTSLYITCPPFGIGAANKLKNRTKNKKLEKKLLDYHATVQDQQWYDWYMKNRAGINYGEDIFKYMYNEVDINVKNTVIPQYDFWQSKMKSAGIAYTSIGGGLIAAGLAMLIFGGSGKALIKAGAVLVSLGLKAIGYGIGGAKTRDHLKDDRKLLQNGNESIAANIDRNSRRFVNLEDSLIIIRRDLAKFSYADEYDNEGNLLVNGRDELKKAFFMDKNQQDTVINYHQLSRSISDNPLTEDQEYAEEVLKEYNGNEKGEYSVIELMQKCLEKAEKDKKDAKNKYFNLVNQLQKKKAADESKYQALKNQYLSIGFDQDESARLWLDIYNVKSMEDAQDITDAAKDTMDLEDQADTTADPGDTTVPELSDDEQLAQQIQASIQGSYQGFDYSLVLRDHMDLQESLYANAQDVTLFGLKKQKNYFEYFNSMSDEVNPADLVMDTNNDDNQYIYDKLVQDDYIDAKGKSSQSILERWIEEAQSNENKTVLKNIKHKIKTELVTGYHQNWSEENWKNFDQNLLNWAQSQGASYLNYARELVVCRETLITSRTIEIEDESGAVKTVNYSQEAKDEYAKTIDLAYQRKMLQQVKIQNNDWDLKIKSFLAEKKDWFDQMTAIRNRAFSDWETMNGKLVKHYRLWKEGIEKEIREKSDEWSQKYTTLLENKQNWLGKAENLALNRSQTEIEEFFNISIDDEISSLKTETGSWVEGVASDVSHLEKMVDDFIGQSNLSKILDHASWSVNNIKMIDTTLSITKIKRSMVGNAISINRKFNDQIDSMSADIQQAVNLRAYQSLLDTVSKYKGTVDKINENTREKNFHRIFREKGYKKNGGKWEREVVAGYNLNNIGNGCEDVETQSIHDYRDYTKHNQLLQLRGLINPQDLNDSDPQMLALLIKDEMEFLKDQMKIILPQVKTDNSLEEIGQINGELVVDTTLRDRFKYDQHKDSIYYHIGDAPKYELHDSSANLASQLKKMTGKDEKNLLFQKQSNSEMIKKQSQKMAGYSSKGIYTGHGETGRIIAEVTLYEIQKQKMRAQLQGNFFSAFELWDTDKNNDGEKDGGFSISLMDTINLGAALAGPSNMLVSFGVSAASQAIDVQYSTAGYSAEEKKRAWSHYGVSMGFQAVAMGAKYGTNKLAKAATTDKFLQKVLKHSFNFAVDNTMDELSFYSHARIDRHYDEKLYGKNAADNNYQKKKDARYGNLGQHLLTKKGGIIDLGFNILSDYFYHHSSDDNIREIVNKKESDGMLTDQEKKDLNNFNLGRNILTDSLELMTRIGVNTAYNDHLGNKYLMLGYSSNLIKRVGDYVATDISNSRQDKKLEELRADKDDPAYQKFAREVDEEIAKKRATDLTIDDQEAAIMRQNMLDQKLYKNYITNTKDGMNYLGVSNFYSFLGKMPFELTRSIYQEIITEEQYNDGLKKKGDSYESLNDRLLKNLVNKTLVKSMAEGGSLLAQYIRSHKFENKKKNNDHLFGEGFWDNNSKETINKTLTEKETEQLLLAKKIAENKSEMKNSFYASSVQILISLAASSTGELLTGGKFDDVGKLFSSAYENSRYKDFYTDLGQSILDDIKSMNQYDSKYKLPRKTIIDENGKPKQVVDYDRLERDWEDLITKYETSPPLEIPTINDRMTNEGNADQSDTAKKEGFFKKWIVNPVVWLWDKAIKPAGTWAYDKLIKPFVDSSDAKKSLQKFATTLIMDGKVDTEQIGLAVNAGLVEHYKKLVSANNKKKIENLELKEEEIEETITGLFAYYGNQAYDDYQSQINGLEEKYSHIEDEEKKNKAIQEAKIKIAKNTMLKYQNYNTTLLFNSLGTLSISALFGCKAKGNETLKNIYNIHNTRVYGSFKSSYDYGMKYKHNYLPDELFFNEKLWY